MDELMPQTKHATTPIALSDAAMDRLPADVSRPTYDRANLTPGILHIGLGNFHRAHQAWYLHRLMQLGQAHDWAIIGAGVRSYDAEMRKKLLAQDCLTTLIELDPSGSSAEVSGSMIDYVEIADDNGPLIRAMADPSIRIVGLTVTEGGYYEDQRSGGLDTAHSDIVDDAANPERPRTAFGAMVAALRARRAAGVAPFTGLSCDNLQGNGDILRQTVVELARMSDPSLADWIDDNATFPNSMVDCIVPATGPHELELAQTFGILDAAPVAHENYRQWVIEDRFVSGRPDWDSVGAVFTDEVHSYETMKIRLLNAGHQVLANAGELLSIPTIADCMAHPELHTFWRKVEQTEIAPYVEPVPGMTPGAYIDLIERRFANTEIRDTTRRVAFDGSSRHTGFVLPILLDALQAGGDIEGLALVEALWARMCFGTREDGSEIAPNDPMWEQLATTARTARDRPSAWLEQRQIYGGIVDEPTFEASFSSWLDALWSDGVLTALQRYVAQ